MLWWVTLHPSWARRRRLMALYCAGLLLLLAVLVTRSPWFGLFAITGYCTPGSCCPAAGGSPG